MVVIPYKLGISLSPFPGGKWNLREIESLAQGHPVAKPGQAWVCYLSCLCFFPQQEKSRAASQSQSFFGGGGWIRSWRYQGNLRLWCHLSRSGEASRTWIHGDGGMLIVAQQRTGEKSVASWKLRQCKRELSSKETTRFLGTIFIKE